MAEPSFVAPPQLRAMLIVGQHTNITAVPIALTQPYPSWGSHPSYAAIEGHQAMAQFRRVRRSVIAFAPRPGATRWIDEELVGEPYKIVFVPSMAALMSRLSERVDQIAIVDFDAVTEDDIEAFAALRDSTWTGELIALGRIDIEIRMLLRVREMIMRPLGSERLRRSLSTICVEQSLAISGTEQTAEISPFR